MRVVSGAQPTGALHIGNYLGSIRNWIDIQEDVAKDFEAFFLIANYHSITVKTEPKKLSNDILLTIATYLACGVNLDKSHIILQSNISAHTELAWVLSSITPIGWLNRMIQFKEKNRNGENASVALYTYPILMAADILLYDANLVPVGDDQKQHLELTIDIANRFEQIYKINPFTIPKPHITSDITRIMSLNDASNKMSKSNISDKSRINLTDTATQISKKISSAKTDSYAYISYDKQNRPELANLLNIFYGFYSIDNKELSFEEFVTSMEGCNFAQFKKACAECIISYVEPISKEIDKLFEDKAYLANSILPSQNYANEVANNKIKKIFSIIGF